MALYAFATAEGFGENRSLREQGYSEIDSFVGALGKAGYTVAAEKVDDYIGKNNPISDYYSALDTANDVFWKKYLEKGNKNNIIKMNMQFFSEKDIGKQSSNSLKRGIRSFNKLIDEHKDKIKNPQKYDVEELIKRGEEFDD